MTIYLYKKTHNITGLNYLGKTTQDPFKYSGSGKYWRNHLKKHGNDITTVILKECQDPDELKTWGIYYSELWKVVESDEWANIKPENGDGGDTSLTPNYLKSKPRFSHKGEANPNYKHGNATKEAVEARKDALNGKHGNYGKKRPNISGDNHYESKSVNTPMGVFTTVTAAAKAHGVTRSIITKRIRKGVEGYSYSSKVAHVPNGGVTVLAYSP